MFIPWSVSDSSGQVFNFKTSHSPDTGKRKKERNKEILMPTLHKVSIEKPEIKFSTHIKMQKLAQGSEIY